LFFILASENSEVHGSAPPPAKKTAGQIEKKKLMNIERPTSTIE